MRKRYIDRGRERKRERERERGGQRNVQIFFYTSIFPHLPEYLSITFIQIRNDLAVTSVKLCYFLCILSNFYKFSVNF